MRRAAAGAALVLACAVAAYPLGLARPHALLVVLAVSGVVLAGAALASPWGWTSWTAASFLATEYGAAVVVADPRVDVYAPAVAAALYLLVESCDLARGDEPVSRRVFGARVWHSAGIAFGSAVAAAVLLIAGAASGVAGAAAIGGAALCGVLVLLGLGFLASSKT